ncbi:fungal-specific transcription factor domain-containing protein [Plectosphaerella plurivora]|uniref:Fungal-specific transcription factor domain-containing protein n=1 Tax=Plectosphaerella plurivora TaxID=936078 RepID=A0A9P8V7Q6_9PEZI|nr:fungal-specific transcription factor domain-containing protein [Plectosphaerella plurivora]
MEKPPRVAVKLACARCQRRKIKCDGQVPKCGNCQTAGVECADGDSARFGPVRDLHRAKIRRLQQRVHDLEAIIRARCPDVELPGDDQDLDLSVLDVQAPAPAASETPPAPITISAPAAPLLPPAHGLLAHEIGLVSLGSTQDARYIGPSSGYFLARLMLASGSGDLPAPTALPAGLVECLQGPAPLPPSDRAAQLSAAFFDVLHPQYPILHEPAFAGMLTRAAAPDADHADSFRVFMVLALGAIVLSQRHRVRLPAEGYCLAALEHLDAVNVENSLAGLQCLLLLMLFTMHCPNMRANLWYLDYQCIASVLDLGLQRDVRTGSPLDQALRTRLFWVVMTLDRRIATMMGRPIGLRDEACDLRLPSCDPIALHLFKLTKLNSELKYVANSVVRDTPRWAYPAVINILDWQADLLTRLDTWDLAIPDTNQYHLQVCRLRGLELRMVCLRPSPAIPTPTTQATRACHAAARQALGVFGELYRGGLLVHGWDTFYSVTLSIITLLYCVKVVPALATPAALGDDLAAGLRVLGAVAEHWIGAKRCRDILEEVGQALVVWLGGQQHALPVDDALLPSLPGDFFGGLGMDDSFTEQLMMGDAGDMDAMMRSLFDDFIPADYEV